VYDVSEYPREVVDEEGNAFVVVPQPLGRGGQGVVFRTRDPDVAVKFVLPPEAPPPPVPGQRPSERLHARWTVAPPNRPDPSASARHQLRERLEDVRILPLPQLHIAKPLSMLRGHVGYTMQLLRGMVALQHLIAPPGTADLPAFYRAGGGLRRRLRLLEGAASLLTRLHGVPLVYGDVSPANIFVSESVEANEVWLIDADNLAFESFSMIHTPGYGAPEIVQRSASVTTLSDAWSFAVLAFHVLAQVHPFLGDHVDEAGWDDDENPEELAFAGKLPWIDDPADRSNETKRGIPRAIAVSPTLCELFTQMFGPGRRRREDRPSLGRFVDALRQAADLTLACPRCGFTFYARTVRCPLCPGSARPAFLHAQVSRFEPELDDSDAAALAAAPVWHAIVDAQGGGTASLRRHVFAPTLVSEADPPVLELQLLRGRLVLTALPGSELWLAGRGAEPPLRFEGSRPFPLPVAGREIVLYGGPPSGSRRLVMLRYGEAGA
jgi:hypothetical protein